MNRTPRQTGDDLRQYAALTAALLDYLAETADASVHSRQILPDVLMIAAERTHFLYGLLDDVDIVPAGDPLNAVSGSQPHA